MKQRNFVQKYVEQFNRPQVFVDKKKESKKGNCKHKNKIFKEYSKVLSRRVF